MGQMRTHDAPAPPNVPESHVSSSSLAADGAQVVVNYSKGAPAADQVVADVTAVGGGASR